MIITITKCEWMRGCHQWKSCRCQTSTRFTKHRWLALPTSDTQKQRERWMDGLVTGIREIRFWQGVQSFAAHLTSKERLPLSVGPGPHENGARCESNSSSTAGQVSGLHGWHTLGINVVQADVQHRGCCRLLFGVNCGGQVQHFDHSRSLGDCLTNHGRIVMQRGEQAVGERRATHQPADCVPVSERVCSKAFSVAQISGLLWCDQTLASATETAALQ